MKIAITGGIGSGKSYVCRLLAQRGIDVYDCDAAAKRLMRESAELQQALCRVVGNDVYKDGILQKAVLAKFILSSDTNRQAIDNTVHPAVAADFLASGKVWLESAILFGSGFHHRVRFDHVVCVSAPIEVRIGRIMARDNLTREKALEWIGRQMPQEEVERRSDYTIVNDGHDNNLNTQIDKILNEINNLH